jgi:hypothetical protein
MCFSSAEARAVVRGPVLVPAVKNDRASAAGLAAPRRRTATRRAGQRGNEQAGLLYAAAVIAGPQTDAEACDYSTGLVLQLLQDRDAVLGRPAPGIRDLGTRADDPFHHGHHLPLVLIGRGVLFPLVGRGVFNSE